MQKSEFILEEICRTFWEKNVSRNTITYRLQTEGPSTLWKPGSICMGKQASRKATAWVWREPSNNFIAKQWACSWALSGSKGKGRESHSAWMIFFPVDKIADIQKQRTAGISFDQLAVSLDESVSVLPEVSSVDFCKQIDVAQLHASS